ncbi:hypothetical protein llg_14580 [Luteolibacter sp. LG18]|nr:hypothetical protein llg_14580 [Luteolibacter sp. LG18]
MVFSSSCASRHDLGRVIFQEPDYVVREVRVSGRPVLAKRGDEVTLMIVGFSEPGGGTYNIDHPVAGRVLQQKLDRAKSYTFQVYTTDQTRSKNDHIRHAILSKVEDRGTVILDASVCDVHHCPMTFGAAVNVDWWLKSRREQRGLETYHNHGYSLPSCCSGGLVHEWTWHCPRCARTVDGFKSKFEPG